MPSKYQGGTRGSTPRPGNQFDSSGHVEQGSGTKVNVPAAPKAPTQNFGINGAPRQSAKIIDFASISGNVQGREQATPTPESPSIIKQEEPERKTQEPTASQASTMQVTEETKPDEGVAPDGQPVITATAPRQTTAPASTAQTNEAGFPVETTTITTPTSSTNELDDNQPTISYSPEAADNAHGEANAVRAQKPETPKQQEERLYVPKVNKSQTISLQQDARHQVAEDFSDIKNQLNNIEDIADVSLDMSPQEVVDPVPKIAGLSTVPIEAVSDKAQKEVDDKAKQKRLAGNAVWSVIVGDRKLELYDISVSLSDLRAMLREPDSMLAKRLVEELEFRREKEIDQVPWTESIVIDMIENNKPITSNDGTEMYIQDFINRYDIMVYAQKDPVTSPGDAHQRRLRIHDDTDAMKLHPLAAKLMNADHDGDRVKVDFRRDMLAKRPFAIDLLVQQNGVSIDFDFAVIYPYDLGRIHDILTDIMGQTWVSRNRETFTIVSNALYKMSHTNDGDEFSRQWKVALQAIYSSYGKDYRRARAFTSKFFTEYIRWNSDDMRRETARKALNRFSPSDYGGPIVAKGKASQDTIARFNHWAELVVNGDIPNNWQAFCNIMGFPIETVEGKNAYFRLQGIGKAVKLSGDIVVGNDIVVSKKTFPKLLNATMEMRMVAAISNIDNENEETFYEAQELRKAIIRPGLSDELIPIRYGDNYRAFLEDFRVRSNPIYSIAASSNIEVRSNYKDAKRLGKFQKGYKEATNTVGLVDRLLDVYGDMTIETLFPESSCRGAITETFGNNFYKNFGQMTVHEFVRNNDLIPPGGNIKRDLRKNLPGESVFKKRNGQEIRSNPVKDVVYALIMKRGSQGATFEKNLVEAAEDVLKITRKLRVILYKRDKKGGVIRDDDGHLVLADDVYKNQTIIEHGLRSIALLHYEAFRFHGIADPFSFLESKYGQALLHATSVEDVIRIRTHMVMAMQISKINNAVQEYKNTKKKYEEQARQKSSNSPSIEVQNTRVAKELAAIASSSPFWRILITDILQDGRLFRQMKIEGAYAYQNQDKYGNMVTANSTRLQFRKWNRVIKEDTLADYLLNNATNWYSEKDEKGKRKYNGKDTVLADMIQFYTGQPTEVYDVFYQIDQNAASSYTTGRYGYESNGYNDIMEKMKSLNSIAEGKWNENTYRNMKADVAKTYEKYSSNPEVILQLVNRAANWRSALGYIGRDVYADAINGATMYKEYGDTEKNRQKFSLQFIFNATFMSRNGMLVSDYEFIDDLNSGRMREDVFLRSPGVIARIIADPSLELEVYNKDGSYIVSCETMGINAAGNPTEYAQSIWNFFMENPRVAMAFRSMRASTGEEGSCHINAIGNLDSAIAEAVDQVDTVGKIRDEITVRLMDHPSFASICVAVAGIRNHTTATMRNRYSEAVYDVVDAMMWSYATGKEPSDILDTSTLKTGIDLYDETTSYIQERFIALSGEVRDVIVSLGYDSDQLRREIEAYTRVEELNNQIREEQEKAIGNKNTEKKKEKYYREFKKTPLKFNVFNIDGSIDVNTIRGIKDCEQMLAGAKTATSTGVNGAETRKLGMLPYYLMKKPEKCDTEAVQVLARDIVKDKGTKGGHYIGWHEVDEKGNHVGYINEARIAELEMKSGDSVIYLKDPALCSCHGSTCVDCATSDGTLNNKPEEQISAAALMTLIYRTDSTEAKNLKIRKLGVESKDSPWYDSISRLDIWDVLRSNGWKNVRNRIMYAYQRDGLPRAYRVYANYMMKINKQAGYDDMSFNQYVDIARILLREVPSASNPDTIELRILSIHQLASAINENLTYELAEQINTAQDMIDWCDQEIEKYINMPMRKTNIDGLFDRMVVQTSAFGSLLQGTVLKQNSSMERNNAVLTEQYMDNVSSIHHRLQEMEIVRPDIFEKVSERLNSLNIKKYKNLANKLVLEEEIDYFIPVPRGPAATVEFKYDPKAQRTDKYWRQVKFVMDQCKDSGTTVIYDSRDTELDDFIRDNYLEGHNNKVDDIVDRQAFNRNQEYPQVVIPWFNIALNGNDDPLVVDPSFNVGTFLMPAERLVRVCASTEIDNGDAHLTGTTHFFDRTQAVKDGDYEITHNTLFSAWASEHNGYVNGQIEIVTPDMFLTNVIQVINYVNSEVAKGNIAPEDMIDAIWDHPDFPDFDLGYFRPSNDVKSSNWHAERVRLLSDIRKLARKFSDQGGDGTEFAECQPGDLIGFAWTIVQDNDGVQHKIWSPIRPYELAEGKGTPRNFDMSMLAVNPNTNNVTFHWFHNSSLRHHSTKMFEGSSPWNKMTLDGVEERDHNLVNGQKIDMLYHHSTTKSRYTDASLRNTMIRSMFMESRHEPFGYNAAEKEDFIPFKKDAAIKQAVLTGMVEEDGALVPVNIGHWKKWMENGLTFFNPRNSDERQRVWNKRMNAFITDQVNKCIHCGVNPSVFLSSYVYDENGEKQRTDVAFHWDILFDEGGTTYQDNIMTFFNYLMPNFCQPDSSYTFDWDTVGNGKSPNTDTFFVVDPKTKTLMRLVQYFDPDGQEYWIPQHVVTDYWFGDEHYSGFCRAYVGPSHKSISAMLASALWNTEGSGADVSHLIQSITSDYDTLSSLCKTYIIDPDQSGSE